MSKKLQVISDVMGQCSETQIDYLFSKVAELPTTAEKTKMISECLNRELGAYGFKTFVSPDKTMVFVDDNSISKIIDFLEYPGSQNYVTAEQVERVKAITKISEDNQISIAWPLKDYEKYYYYAKQVLFSGAHLYNVLNVNSASIASAAMSTTGAASLTMGGTMALSWSGGLFLSTLENYIPNSMVRTKAAVCGLKFVISLPVWCTEWTTNQISGAVERVVTKRGLTLPINVTDVARLNVGPKLKEISNFRKPALQWLINKLQQYAE